MTHHSAAWQSAWQWFLVTTACGFLVGLFTTPGLAWDMFGKSRITVHRPDCVIGSRPPSKDPIDIEEETYLFGQLVHHKISYVDGRAVETGNKLYVVAFFVLSAIIPGVLMGLLFGILRWWYCRTHPRYEWPSGGEIDLLDGGSC